MFEQLDCGSGGRKRRDLAVTLVEALESRILAGLIREGEKLPTEAALMGQFGVSRTVVRDALSRMKAGGWVKSRQGSGSFVSSTGHGNAPGTQGPRHLVGLQFALDILELRVGLESEAAALAAQRRSASDLNHIRNAHEVLQTDLPDENVRALAYLDFHLKIAQGAHSPQYLSALEAVSAAMVSLSVFQRMHAMNARVTWELQEMSERGEILLAIERRDSEGARAAMRLHLANSRVRRLAISLETTVADLRRD